MPSPASWARTRSSWCRPDEYRILTAAARRQAQLAFLASGTEFRLGRAEDCPLPPEQLAAVRGDEPGCAPASTTA